MKTTIGIDIDDTLAVHIPELIAFSNARYGTNLTLETYQETWANFWEGDRDEVLRRAKEFHELTIDRYKTIEDAVDVLTRLAQHHKLVIVTARPKYNIDPTYKWLEQNFGNLFEEVHFVPVWEAGPTKTKAEICREIGADYLIDDIPRHCNMAAEADVTALLFGDYKWHSKEPVHPDVVHVNSWKAVEKYFDAES